MGTCTLYLPKSCPLPSVTVSGNAKTLKQLACLEACKKLHIIGALSDNLVPDLVEVKDAEEMGIQNPNYTLIEVISTFVCPSDILLMVQY